MFSGLWVCVEGAAILPPAAEHQAQPVSALPSSACGRSDPGPDAALVDHLLSAISSHLGAPVGVRHLGTLRPDNAHLLTGFLQTKPEGTLFVPSGFVL